jgi:ankyrin repeat protein
MKRMCSSDIREGDGSATKANATPDELLRGQGIDLHKSFMWRHTFTHYPGGLERVVQLMIEFGVDLNMRDECGKTPLHAASEDGLPSIAKMLLERGADVTIVDGNPDEIYSRKLQRTALHYACRKGHESIAKMLIESGADWNALDVDDDSPFISACRKDQASVVKMLIASGADVNNNIRESLQTPLHAACGNWNESVAKVLIESGADIYAMDRHGEIPLLLCCERFSGCLTQSLIDNGADIHFKDQNGGGLLHSVGTMGCSSTAELLIEKGVPIDLQNEDGYTPLHAAIQNLHDDIVKLLIECGADVKIQAKVDGRTPLHVACGDDDCHENINSDHDDRLQNIIRELIFAGADTQVRDRYGFLPYDLLVHTDEDEFFATMGVMDAFKRYEEEARILAQYPKQPVLK